MKKILLTIAAAGLTAGAFGQGLVILENSAGSGNVTYNSSAGPLAGPAAIPYQVALLWNNGSSFVQIGSVYQVASASGDGPGYFNGENVTVPTYSATGSFEVEGWTGNFANYGAAVSGGAYVGLTASFTSPEGNPNGSPPGGALALSGSGGGWNGNLVLIVPEPSTIALGGLGAAALLLFRRRK
jgi:hypothetical protein